MTGEMMFHFSSTSLGEKLNQCLTDTPHEYCAMEAPESTGQQIVIETRLRAYSCFGIATVSIPYEILKHNLILDCAIETMNACILIADDKSDVEQDKLEKHKEWLNNQYLSNGAALKHIGMSDLSLDNELDTCLPLPNYMIKRRGKSFADYLKKQGMNIGKGLETIIDQSEIYKEWEEPREFDALTAEKAASVALLQDQLFNDGAGPVQTVKILQKIKKAVELELDDIKGNILKDDNEVYEKIISSQIGKLLLLQEQRAIPFLNAKLIRAIDKHLKKLKLHMVAYRDFLKKKLKIYLLENSKDQLNLIINKTNEEERRFQAILERLGNRRKAYEDSKLVRNAVSKNIHYIDFQYCNNLILLLIYASSFLNRLDSGIRK